MMETPTISNYATSSVAYNAANMGAGRVAPITEAAHVVSDEIRTASARLNVLADRLVPLLKPEPPVNAVKGGSVPMPVRSPFECDLCNSADMARDLTERINDLLDRLGV